MSTYATSTWGCLSVSEALLRVNNLSAGYSGSLVLRDVAFELAPGEMVALVGRNGVGKTTFVRTLVGILQPQRGEIRHDGHEVSRWPIHRRARVGLRFVAEDRGLFPNLTVRENLDVAAMYSRDGGDSASVARALERFPKLAERSHQEAGSLSGGEQRMLALARALVSGPRVLIVDEFSEGLQPSITQELAAALVQANNDGLAIVLVEQNVRLALRLAERAYIMEKGRMVYEGPARVLQEDEALLSKYLVV